MNSRIIIFIVSLVCFLPLYGQVQTLDYVPGEAIIQLRTNYQQDRKIADIERSFQKRYTIEKALHAELGIYLISFDPSIDIQVAISELKAARDISYVQKNHIVEERDNEPDDPFFLDQWYHQNIETAAAWDVTTGGTDPLGREIVLAVLDRGFDINHEDIAQNVWVNKDEIPDDNIDNDNNGFIDDYYGWNFEVSNDNHSNSPGPHGTNVAGIAGARGDNDKGISGVIWDVKLLFMSGLGTVAKIIEANAYVAETRKRYNETDGREGAFIVAANLSLGVSFAFAEDNPIWCSQYNDMGQNGVLSVCAAPNDNSDVEILGDMPTTCTSDYLLTVTNTDINNEMTDAGFGSVSIDLGAPGTDNITTSPNNNYNMVGGTSVSAPLVAGAIALLYSAPCTSIAERSITNPDEVALSIKNVIFSGATPIPSLEGITTQGSILNVRGSMLELDTNCASNDAQDNQLSILKNPIAQFGEDITLDLVAIQDEGEVYIRVFDAKGALMIENITNRSFFGTNRIVVPTANRLGAGIYMVSLMLSDKMTYTQKLVVY